jgi:hypothetical protein
MFNKSPSLVSALIFLLLSCSSHAETLDTLLEGLDGKQHALSNYIGKGK